MRKIFYILVALMSISTLSTAQNSKTNSDTSSNSVRSDRQIAITTVAGIKTITGIGVIGSYYATPNFAIDLGLGTSFRGFRTALGGRYLFLDYNFTPLLGAALVYQTGKFDLNTKLDQSIIDQTTGEIILQEREVTIQILPSLYTQLVTGFEIMTDGGFILGLTAGYRIALNDAIEGAIGVDGQELSVDDQVIDIANNIIGSGVSFALNLGYAF